MATGDGSGGGVVIEVSHVLPEQVDHVWERVLPQIERGLKHGAGDSTTSDHIRDAVKRGDMTLWAVHEHDDIIAAVVLERARHPAKTALFVVLIAGRDFYRWAPEVNERIKELAELVGADTIEAMVRDGLTHWLADLGWRRKATLMEMSYGRQV
jgi:hypothetical protein